MIFKQVRKVVLQVIVTTWIYGLIYYHVSDANFWTKRETQFHAKTLLQREKFRNMKLWTAWPNPTFRIGYFSEYMKYWMWSRKEHKSKTKQNKTKTSKNYCPFRTFGFLRLWKRTTRTIFFIICPQYLSPGKSVPLYPLFCCPSSDLYRSSSHSRLD